MYKDVYTCIIYRFLNKFNLQNIPLKLCLKACNSVIKAVFHPVMFKRSFKTVLKGMRRDV